MALVLLCLYSFWDWWQNDKFTGILFRNLDLQQLTPCYAFIPFEIGDKMTSSPGDYFGILTFNNSRLAMFLFLLRLVAKWQVPRYYFGILTFHNSCLAMLLFLLRLVAKWQVHRDTISESWPSTTHALLCFYSFWDWWQNDKFRDTISESWPSTTLVLLCFYSFWDWWQNDKFTGILFRNLDLQQLTPCYVFIPDHNPTMLIHGFSTIGKGSFVVTVDKMNPISIPPFPSQVNSHHPMS